jgi:small subunit ribosomal protein S20
LPAKARPKKNISAEKRVRQSVKRNLRNRSVVSGVRTFVKKVETAVSSRDREDAEKELLQAIKSLNQAASKGVIPKNTASRNISRLTKKVNALPPQADLTATATA